jgi:cephalosporin hydroxylase
MTLEIQHQDFEGDKLRKQIKADYVKNKKVIDAFHRLFYHCQYTWKADKWVGVPVLKSPFDLWMLQELVYEIKPQLVIETGTAFGGSALYLAHILDLVFPNNYNIGGIMSIDIDNDKCRDKLPKHPRINYITSNSTEPKLIQHLKKVTKSLKPIIVILDSLHLTDHVLKELNLYSQFVTKGSVLVVEDTNLGEIVQQDVKKKHGRIGPMKAVEQFLKENKEFKSEILCERFHLTFHPKGWLLRG